MQVSPHVLPAWQVLQQFCPAATWRLRAEPDRTSVARAGTATASATRATITRLFTGKHSEAATTPIYPEPRPNDGHSSASDLATSASDGVQRDAAAASQGVAAALADGPDVLASVAHGRQREEP